MIEGFHPLMCLILIKIEEKILEALAWRSESPLWENIRKSGLPVPSCEDVCLPGQLDDNMSSVPCPNPVIRRLTTGIDRAASTQSKYLLCERFSGQHLVCEYAVCICFMFHESVTL
jgi:hypothetical protein